MKKTILVVPLLILLFSCNVQKRKYQKGYYVNWDKHQHKTGGTVQGSKITKVKPESKKSFGPEKQIDLPIENVLVSAKNEAAFIDLLPKETIQLKKDENCDDLIFKDGSEIKVKVIEITSTEIKYKKCDFPDGPNYVVKKSEIFMVKYANGTREVFKTENQTATNNQQSTRGSKYLKTHPMAIASLIMGILGVWPLTALASIFAVIFGNIALRKIREAPTVYKGEGLATAGKILGIVILSVSLLITILFLIILFSII